MKLFSCTFLILLLCTPVGFAKPVEQIATGDEVSIHGGGDGRIFSAGWRVHIGAGDYLEDILAVGTHITLNPTQTLAPVYAFGQTIDLGGTFNKTLAAAGQEIVLRESGKALGDVWLSGNKVWLKGDVAADGKILAGRVIIAGRVTAQQGKQLEIQTKELEILEDAEIQGNILYRGEAQPRIHEGANITGTMTHNDETFEDKLTEKLKKIAFLGQLGSKLMLLVWLLAAGLILSLFMAPKMVASTKRLRRAPLQMMAVGLGFLVAMPIVAVFLLISVVGMPVGISMMASYPLAIIMGFSIGTLWLGMLLFELIFRRKPQRRHQLLGSYFMAVPLVVAVTQVPYIGGLGWLVPLCAGLGAFAWLRWQQLQAGKT